MDWGLLSIWSAEQYDACSWTIVRQVKQALSEASFTFDEEV
jgi:hypothetical protein